MATLVSNGQKARKRVRTAGSNPDVEQANKRLRTAGSFPVTQNEPNVIAPGPPSQEEIRKRALSVLFNEFKDFQTTEGLIQSVLDRAKGDSEVARGMLKERKNFLRYGGSFQTRDGCFCATWDSKNWRGISALENARMIGGYGSD